MTFPHGPEELTTDWLSTALGREVKSFDLEQVGIGVGLLGRLYRVTPDHGQSAIAKFATLDETARMNVIGPLRFYEKEVSFYQEAAANAPVAVPRPFAAEFDRETGDFVLLLEDMGTRRMCDQTAGCVFEDAKTAIDAMASLHAHYWDHDFTSMPWLPVYADPPFPQIIAGMYKQAWPGALEILGDRMPAKYREYGERFPELVQWFIDGISVGPYTFVHGDFRLDNLFFATDPCEPPVAVGDFQISFKGRGGYDLGYFVSQSLTPENRRAHEQELFDAYHAGLAKRGVDYPIEMLRDDYRRTVAYCFCYPVISAGQIDFTNERHRELIEGMLDRAIQAIEDNDALTLLP